MAKPDYLTPERAAELIPQGRVKQALLCPHCRMVLYVGERPHKRGRKKPAPGSRRGASRAKPPLPDPKPTPPAAEHYLDKPADPLKPVRQVLGGE